MKLGAWIKEFPGAVTVSDAGGIILELNDRALTMFASDGGAALIGTNMLDCHPGSARAKLEELMRARRSNSYTTEKKGVHKFVHQAPWYENGEYRGYVELVLEIPAPLPHFVRT
jgi:transcriptional regulator with PAS, ATPase and Fis domain